MRVALLTVLLTFPTMTTPPDTEAAGRPARRDAGEHGRHAAERAEAQARRLHALFAEDWEWRMRDEPVWASMLGDHRFDDRWQDLSLDAHAARRAHAQAMVRRVERGTWDRLSAENRLNLELFEKSYRDDLAEHDFLGWLVPLSQRGGIQTQHETANRLTMERADDFEAWLARLSTMDEQVDQTIALMREGVKRGVTSPRVLMERIPAQLDQQVVESARDSPFWKTFEDLPDAIPEADQRRLRAQARTVIVETVLPAYERFRTFFVDEYLPATRTAIGASALPNGEAFYAHRVRRYTTTEMTPREVHELGLAEVGRIRAEMESIKEQVGFEGTLPEFFTHLRTDPRFHVTDPEELLRRYRAASKRYDPEMTKLFGRLPRAPYGVEPIPALIAPDTTTAYYSRPAPDGSRPGTYWVNLHRPETRYLWEIPALTLHEAVPGHHLQIALAQELGELPEFRRHSGYTAFVEGWGLYAESLGEDIGAYDDPHDRFGQLTYEMWRAVRLVVDTGIHAFGWDRQRAIDYFAANAPRSENDIVNEIDRYISWPGQALAYKVGELRIKALRARAEARLGDAFDLRAFHDTVLELGAVPLDTLERHVDAWIERETGQRAESAKPEG